MRPFLAVTSCLLLIAPVVLIALRAAYRDRPMARAPKTVLLAVYLVPAIVPLVMAFAWRFHGTRIVIELCGVAFRSLGDDPIRKRIAERTPGSGRIVINDVPEARSRRQRSRESSVGTITFHPNPRGEVASGTATIELPAPQLRSGVIRVGNEGFLGSVAIEDGDRICIDADCWTYDADTRAFSNSASSATLPPRRAKLPGIDFAFPLPWAAPPSANLRTYPLKWFAARSPSGSSPRSVRSFLCYAKPDSRLRIVVLDSDVSVKRDGKNVEIPTTATLDRERALAFYSLPRESEELEAQGIVERRSVVYRPGRRSFVLQFDTPEVHSMNTDEFEALLMGTPDRRKSDPAVGLAMGNAQLTDRSLYFTGISESVALQASSIFNLPRYFPILGNDFQIVSPRGATMAVLGQVSWIGATDLAAVKFDVLRPPLLLLLIGVALQFAKVVAARSAQFTIVQALFAGAIESLVCVRLLLGHRIWALPPHEVEGLELAIVAWFALPWMFLAAAARVTLPPTDDRHRAGFLNEPWLPAAAGLLISAVVCARAVEGPKKLVWIACHLLAVGVALIRHAGVRARAFDRLRKLASLARKAVLWVASREWFRRLGQWWQRLVDKVDGLRREIHSDRWIVRLVLGTVGATLIWLLVRNFAEPEWILGLELACFAAGFFSIVIARWTRRLLSTAMRPWVIAAFVLFAIRFVLVLFGFKESVLVFGTRLALSVIHVPAALILEATFLAAVWRRARRDGILAGSDIATSVLVIVFVWALPALVTSDIGLALLHLPVFALVLFDVRRRAGLLQDAVARERVLHAVPAMIVIASILVIAVAPAWRLLLPLFGSDEKLLERASDSNFARFIYFAEPEVVKELATKQGESLAVTSAILQRYISTGLTGRGYGFSEISPHLGDTALRDFAPAVFVAAEWGFAGTVALLLLYAASGLIGRLIAPWRLLTSAEHGEPAMLSYLAAATLAVASIYMILANHELVLLTGKNAYLLGLDSAGDVLETLMLLLLIAFGTAYLRDAHQQADGENR